MIKVGAELGDKGCRGRYEGASAIPAAWLHAYAYWSDDEQKIITVSSWVSREACGAWRASWEETRRRAAMAPYVLSEQEVFYRGRELMVPE